MAKKLKTYFASDFHLGLDTDTESSRERETRILRWLDTIRSDAKAIYLVGDVFDYWFEYREVVPRGHYRLLAKMDELVQQGIEIHVFTGNHDMWMFDYLADDIGVTIHRQPVSVTIGDRSFLIGHGDGLGSGDYGYKLIKTIFSNRICQCLFSLIHPSLGLAVMRWFSQKSRALQKQENLDKLNVNKERILGFCEDYSKEHNVDFYIFGHRHIAIDHLMSNKKSRYINLGEWMFVRSYGVFDGEEFTLNFFENEQGKILT